MKERVFPRLAKGKGESIHWRRKDRLSSEEVKGTRGPV